MIRSTELKATKTLVSSRNSARIVKTSIDKPSVRPVFPPLFRMTRVARTPLPGSSVAEQVTVNHLVAGSIPARAASLHAICGQEEGVLCSRQMPLAEVRTDGSMTGLSTDRFNWLSPDFSPKSLTL